MAPRRTSGSNGTARSPDRPEPSRPVDPPHIHEDVARRLSLAREQSTHTAPGAPLEPERDPEGACAGLVLDLLTDPRGRTSITRGLRVAANHAATREIPVERLVEAVTSATRAVWQARSDVGAHSAALVDDGDAVIGAINHAIANVVAAYAEADRSLAAREADARRSFLDELISTRSQDRRDALRRRRRAERHGLAPDRHYRLTIFSAGPASSDSAVDAMIAGIRRELGTNRPGRGLAYALPEVVEWRGRAVIVDLAGRDDRSRVRGAFERAAASLRGTAWVAVAGPEVGHVDLLAASMERLRDAVRTAERIGRRGWISSTDDLDLETLLSLDEDLRTRAIETELGPLIADSRLGSALVDTVEAYFATGHNASEAARLLHLSPRTVTYRLQRVAELLDHPLDGAAMSRLAVALFAYRLQTAEGSSVRV